MCPATLHELQRHIVLLGQTAHVHEGIAHTAECRVDADVGRFRYFLERHLLIEAHVDHFALRGRQNLHDAADVLHHLRVDELALDVRLKQLIATQV